MNRPWFCTANLANLQFCTLNNSLKHRELLAPFGLDASEPAFWSQGLDPIAGFVDELKAVL